MSDFLYHHGVKGMKWGVRKDNSSKSERKQKRTQRAINSERRRIKDLNVKYQRDLRLAQRTNNQYLITVKKSQIEITNRVLKDIGNMKASDIKPRHVQGKVFMSTSKNLRDVMNEFNLTDDERLGVLKL